MKSTRAINVTGRATFTYVRSHRTNVAATIRKWLREYEADWDAAHTENAERKLATANVRQMKKAGAK